MSATFVTDLCTAVALSAIFIKPNIWFPVFLVVSLALILALPRIAPWFFGRYGDRVIEPEIKLVFACLLLLMVLRRGVQRSRRPSGVRARPRHEPPLPGAPRGAEAASCRRVRFPDPVLLHQGRSQRLARSRRSHNLGLLAVLLAAKMAPEDRLHLPARTTSRSAPRRPSRPC